MYGWFDKNPNWMKQIEADYMTKTNVHYKYENKGQQKTQKLDTISMLISIVKNDCVKLINRRSISTHNMKITITRREGQGNKSEHRKRRKKGEFQESFLKLHNTLTKNNKKAMKTKNTMKWTKIS